MILRLDILYEMMGRAYIYKYLKDYLYIFLRKKNYWGNDWDGSGNGRIGMDLGGGGNWNGNFSNIYRKFQHI